LVSTTAAVVGTPVVVRVRDSELAGVVVPTPFVRST